MASGGQAGRCTQTSSHDTVHMYIQPQLTQQWQVTPNTCHIKAVVTALLLRRRHVLLLPPPHRRMIDPKTNQTLAAKHTEQCEHSHQPACQPNHLLSCDRHTTRQMQYKDMHGWIGFVSNKRTAAREGQHHGLTTVLSCHVTRVPATRCCAPTAACCHALPQLLEPPAEGRAVAAGVLAGLLLLKVQAKHLAHAVEALVLKVL